MIKELYSTDVDISYFLPTVAKKNLPKKNLNIIILAKRSSKNDVFFCKRKLVGTGIVITESLKRSMELLKEAQQEFGVENTWSVKGKVFVSIKKAFDYMLLRH